MNLLLLLPDIHHIPLKAPLPVRGICQRNFG
jgi:hypothetical protein